MPPAETPRCRHLDLAPEVKNILPFRSNWALGGVAKNTRVEQLPRYRHPLSGGPDSVRVPGCIASQQASRGFRALFMLVGRYRLALELSPAHQLGTTNGSPGTGWLVPPEATLNAAVT